MTKPDVATEKISRLTEVVIIIVVWLVLSVIIAAQRYADSAQLGLHASFQVFLVWSLAIWSYWAVVSPVIFRLGRRFPLDKQHRFSSVAMHFLFAFAFGLAHLAIFAWAGTLFAPPHPGQKLNFQSEFSGSVRLLLYLELIFYWSILMAGTARDSYRKYAEHELAAKELETKLGQAQMQALKMQIQPHFLFNALNTIAMLIRNRENDQAVQMVAGLGDLLRWSLNDNSAQEVTLSSELDFIGRYLAIEQFRFPDRLRVEIDVPKDLLTASVPNLILQPLVENAIRHGIAKSSTGGRLHISAKQQNGWLELSVQDDGPGIPSGWALDQQQGIGLENTRSRLEKLFHNQYEFIVQNAAPTGAQALIKIPYHRLIQAESHAKVQSINS
jgi:signal transduction histidine kinase